MSINFNQFCNLDSSPKTPVAKHAHSMSSDLLFNSPTACITPIRPRKGRPSVPDESPIPLSQEPVNVTWKWGTDSPVRPAGEAARALRPARKVLAAVVATTTATSKSDLTETTITNSNNELSRNSPKGLYKFQEEMRRIQEKQTSESDGAIATDTGCPELNFNTNFSMANDSFSMSPIPMVDATMVEPMKPANMEQTIGNTTLDAIKHDLFNDSDFDQALLSCGDKIETNVAGPAPASTNARSTTITSTVADVSVANATVKQSKDDPVPAVNSYFLDNDESIDDILGSIDDTIIMNSVQKLNQSKMARHNSMPPQNETVNPNNFRRSFTRHESMPISAAEILRGSKVSPSTVASSSMGSTESVQSVVSSNLINIPLFWLIY